MLLNRRCVELVKSLQNDGFECCILKGLGNALMYPNPYSRTPGDMDILVRPKTEERGKKYDVRMAVTEYVRKKFPKTRTRYQHIDYFVFLDVEVEVHFADEWFDMKMSVFLVKSSLLEKQV